MSEQRFYITDTGLGLDTVSDEMYSFGDEEDFCRLFDKLNEQQNIIESERDLFEKYRASAIRDMRDYSDKIIETQKKVDEQQSTIEKQKRIIKSQDAEISRQYNLCLAMSGILREEFGVYDVFDRTKDKNIKKEDD